MLDQEFMTILSNAMAGQKPDLEKDFTSPQLLMLAQMLATTDTAAAHACYKKFGEITPQEIKDPHVAVLLSRAEDCFNNEAVISASTTHRPLKHHRNHSICKMCEHPYCIRSEK